MSNWPLSRISAFSPYSTSTPLTIAAGNSAAGSWVEVVASAPYGVTEVILTRESASTNRSYAFDLGVGALGSEVMIADRLLMLQTDGTGNGTQILRVPIAVSAGQRVAIRAHGVGGTGAVYMNAQFLQGGGLWPVGASRIAVYGMDSSYLGTNVTSSATQFAFGTSVEFSAAIPHAMRGFGITFNGGHNSLTYRGAMRLVDASGNALSASLVTSSGSSTGDNASPILSFLPCAIPAGQAVHVQIANLHASAAARRGFLLYTVH